MAERQSEYNPLKLTLSGLTIESGLTLEPSFNPQVKNYTVHYPDGKTSVALTATRYSEYEADYGTTRGVIYYYLNGAQEQTPINAQHAANQDVFPVELALSVNLNKNNLEKAKVSIPIVSDGQTSTYQITFIRDVACLSDIQIEAPTLSGWEFELEPDFSFDVYHYTLGYDEEEESPVRTVTPVPANQGTEITMVLERRGRDTNYEWVFVSDYEAGDDIALSGPKRLVITCTNGVQTFTYIIEFVMIEFEPIPRN